MIAGLAILLGACTSPASQATPVPPIAQDRPQGEFKFALEGLGVAAWDPAVSLTSAYVIQQFVYDSLIGIDSKGNYSPERSIAESWSSSPDGLTHTFKIRDGVYFSNGDKLTSEDVAYTFQRLRESWVTNPDGIIMVRNIDEIRTPDPLTFIIKVKQPSLTWFSYLSPRDGAVHQIVPKKYIEKVGREAFNANPIGSGPYKIERYQPGVSLTLVPSGTKHWFIGTQRWETIQLLVVPEEATRKAMLLTGQVDAATISRSSVPEVKAAGKNAFMNNDEFATYLFFFNQWQTNLPTSDSRVRKALSMAVDRESICKNLMGGACQRVNGWNGFPYTYDPAAVNFTSVTDWGYKPDEARALLREAGYASGFDIQMYSAPIAGLSEAPDINEAIAGMWRAIGVRARIVPIEYAAWVRSVWCTGAIRPDHTVSSTWLFPHGNRFWSVSHAGILLASKGNCTITKDAELDSLIDKMRAAVTEKEYIDPMTAFGQRVKAESRLVQLFENGAVIGANPATIRTWPFAKIAFMGGLRDFSSSRSR